MGTVCITWWYIRHDSMLATLACHQAVTKEWLDWVAISCEKWHIFTGPIRRIRVNPGASPPISSFSHHPPFCLLNSGLSQSTFFIERPPFFSPQLELFCLAVDLSIHKSKEIRGQIEKNRWTHKRWALIYNVSEGWTGRIIQNHSSLFFGEKPTTISSFTNPKYPQCSMIIQN